MAGEATQVKFGISIRTASDEEKELTPDKRGIAVSQGGKRVLCR